MNAYGLSATQIQTVSCLVRLARSVLESLEVPFTTRHLEETVTEAYCATTVRPVPADEAGGPRLVNWYDPTNAAIIVLEALKRYHVRHTVVTEPAVQDRSATLIILAMEDPGPRFAERVGVLEHEQRDELVIRCADGVRRRVAAAERSSVERYVALTRSEYSGEPGYRAHRYRAWVEQLFALSALAAATTAAGMAVRNGIAEVAPRLWAPLLLLLAAGVYVSYTLFVVDRTSTQGSALLQKLCSSHAKGRNCRAVLASGPSKVLGLVSLVDLGAVYFTSLLAFVVWGLVAHHHEQHLGVLFWAAIAPVPYSLYLIYYQIAVVKNICVLCIAVQTLLLTQFAYLVSLRSAVVAWPLDVPAAATLLLVALSVAALYGAALRGWGLRTRVARLRLEEDRIKTDLDYFDLLARREMAFPETDLPGALVLGNPEAKLRLSAILSPTCAPCGTRLNELRRLVDWFESDVCVTVLIKADEFTEPLVKDVLQCTVAGDHARAAAVVTSWYSSKGANGANGHRPPPADGVEAVFALHREWFQRQRIPHTPMLIYNARSVPHPYWDTDLLIDILERRQEQLCG